jgi:hypothetical protein
MRSRKTLWSRWKAVAQRAAEIQANVVFFLLYYIAIVPMGLLRLGRPSALKRSSRDAPSWIRHERTPPDLASSRRQF